MQDAPLPKGLALQNWKRARSPCQDCKCRVKEGREKKKKKRGYSWDNDGLPNYELGKANSNTSNSSKLPLEQIILILAKGNISPKKWYQGKQLLLQRAHIKDNFRIKNIICEKIMLQNFYSTDISNLQQRKRMNRLKKKTQNKYQPQYQIEGLPL